jgi:leucyl/phenylalanyl-tRNA--protein transferase
VGHYRRHPIFPPVSHADEDGLLKIGGRLSVEWLLAAYRRGIFPWPIVEDDFEALAWFSPDPRSVLELDGLRVSRRLKRRLRSREFEVSCDRAFEEVISWCAQSRRNDPGTWITPSLKRAFCRLHELGHAHSVETWHEGDLVGGIYGVALGGYFSGESMFHRRTDASKVALARLVEHLRARGYTLFDVQQTTAHLQSLGSRELPREVFLERLRAAIRLSVTFGERLEQG